MSIKGILFYLIVVVSFIAFLNGLYMVISNVGYSFFYEDHVKLTIKEMVKPEFLKLAKD